MTVSTSSTLSGVVGERPSKRKFKLRLGGTIMAMRGGRKKKKDDKKKSMRGGRKPMRGGRRRK